MKTVLKKAKLYLVLDREVKGYTTLLKILKGAVRSGVDIVQLRDKYGTGREIIEFSRQVLKFLSHCSRKIPFIINDRVDLAIAAGADGVHLGQDDLPIEMARKIFGQKKIIGSSCQSWAHVTKAQNAGADYIGFGSVFKTLTKPDRQPLNLQLIKKVLAKTKIPVFFIGGIKLANLDLLGQYGAQRVAVTREICLAENVGYTTQQFSQALGKT